MIEGAGGVEVPKALFYAITATLLSARAATGRAGFTKGDTMQETCKAINDKPHMEYIREKLAALPVDELIDTAVKLSLENKDFFYKGRKTG